MTGAASAFLAIPEILLLGWISTGAGRRVCAMLLPDASPLERSVLGFPVGMGLLSLLVTGLLFARAPALPWLLVAALVAALAWSRSDLGDLLRGLRSFIADSRVLAALAAGSAVLGLVGCLAPETGWDTGVYHFTMARLWAEQGGMLVRMDIPYSYRPAYMESLYTAGFALNGETLASLINCSFYFAGLALARLWGLQAGGARGGLFAGLAWLTSATYVLRTDGGDVEVGQALYLGSAMYALGRLRDGGGAGWRVLAGLALGMLVGIKYASIYAVLVLGVVWLAVRIIDRTPWRATIADGLVIGILCLGVACPWYLRNYLATGTPFFPFQAATSDTWTGSPSLESGTWRPLVQALAMDVFILAGIAGLALPACARWRWAGIVPILLTPWMVRLMGIQEAPLTNALRYAAPGWFPLLVLGGLGVSVVLDRGFGWRVVALGSLAGALAIGQGVHAVRNVRKIPVAIGLASRDAYLESRVNTYRAVRDAEAVLPPGRKILLVDERGYYCRAPFLVASDVQTLVNFERFRTPAELRRFLDDAAIGAIVVDRSPVSKTHRFRDLERRLGDGWPLAGLRRVDCRGQASLFLVN
jgi:hypothetical protein